MAEDRISVLKERSKRCVCKYCGSKLHLKRIIFSEIEEAQLELYCEYCRRIEFGTEEAVYQCAVALVEEHEFNYYPELDITEQSKRMNVAKLCEIISFADQKRGFCDEQGFKVPLAMDDRERNGLKIYRAAELVNKGE